MTGKLIDYDDEMDRAMQNRQERKSYAQAWMAQVQDLHARVTMARKSLEVLVQAIQEWRSGKNTVLTAQAAETQAAEALKILSSDTAEDFPMLDGPAIPWPLAWEVYAMDRANNSPNGQSLERIAERGGYGWAEVAYLFKEFKRRGGTR